MKSTCSLLIVAVLLSSSYACAADMISTVFSKNTSILTGKTKVESKACSLQLFKDEQSGIFWVQFMDGGPNPYNIQYVPGSSNWSQDSTNATITFKNSIPKDIEVTLIYDTGTLGFRSVTSSWSNDPCILAVASSN